MASARRGRERSGSRAARAAGAGSAGRPAQAPGTAGSAPRWQRGLPAGPARRRGSDACRARRTGAGRLGPVNPELVGLLEDPRVAVGGADEHDDGPARRDHTAADLDILGGCPGGQLDRAVVAEHLLDRRRYQGRIPAEPGWLFPCQRGDGQPRTVPSVAPEGAGSGRRIMRNESSSPRAPARIGMRSAI
jgi:hypothetical protein